MFGKWVDGDGGRVYVLKRLINWVPHGVIITSLALANISHTGSNSVDKVKWCSLFTSSLLHV